MAGDPASSRLAVSLCGIPLKNPVLAASGTFAYGVEFESILDLDQMGGFVIKGLSREPMDGNKPPRVWEAEGGMLNSIGLQNIGVRAFVAEKLPALRKHSTPVFANVFGYAIEDYCEVVHVLEDHQGLAAYELNVSCPNTKHGGIFFSSDPGLLGQLVSAVRRIARRSGIHKRVGPHTLRHAFITAALDAGVPLRDVQEAASHADPRATMRYDRARVSLDRHATYIVSTFIAGAAR